MTRLSRMADSIWINYDSNAFSSPSVSFSHIFTCVAVSLWSFAPKPLVIEFDSSDEFHESRVMMCSRLCNCFGRTLRLGGTQQWFGCRDGPRCDSHHLCNYRLHTHQFMSLGGVCPSVFCLPVCLFDYLAIGWPIRLLCSLFVSLFVRLRLTVWLSFCPFAFLLDCQAVCPFAYLFFCHSVCLFVLASVHMHVYPFVRLIVCLSSCLPISYTVYLSICQ